MKKKMIQLLIGSLLVISLSACGNDMAMGSEEVFGSEEQMKMLSNEDSDNGETKALSEPIIRDGKEVSYEDLKSEVELYLLPSTYDALYVLDHEGNPLGQFDERDFWQKMENRGYDFHTASIFGISEGVLYLELGGRMDDQYQENVYAVDLNTYDVVTLWQSTQEQEYGGGELYRGKLYIKMQDRYNEDAGEVIFLKDQDTFSFTQSANEPESFYKTLRSIDNQEYYIIDHQETYIPVFTSGHTSYVACLDHYGYVIVKENDRLCRIMKDGTILPLKIDSTDSYIVEFDQDCVLYRCNQGSGEDGYYVYDLKKEQVNKLTSMNKSDDFYGMKDQKAYFVEEKASDFGQQEYVFYQCDLQLDQRKDLFPINAVPGMKGLNPGVYQVINDRVFYVGFENGKLVMMYRDLNAPEQVQNTGCTLALLNAFSCGTVERLSNTVGGKKIYVEGFQVDERFPQASKINTNLRKRMEKDITDENERKGSALISKCPTNYQSKSIYVSDVRILNGKYLCVDYEGTVEDSVTYYDFGYEILFDLESGEELTMKDFYQGTEEEFKDFVANIVQEEECADAQARASSDDCTTPAYNNDADKVYNEVHDQVGFDSYIKFNEDGVYIIYDSDTLIWGRGNINSWGYYDVFISYQDLLGRPKL